MQKFFALVIAIVLVKQGSASLPQIKSYDKQKDLIDGRVKGISITGDGELLLAPVARQIFSSERPFIWDFVVDSRGNLSVATGDAAKIYQVSPDGNTKIIAEWENIEVYSLAIDNKGILYAGTSPDGKIYRIFQDKKPEPFVDLKVKYIWDILFDKQHNCYVATGDSGSIYLIDEQGKSSIFYSSDETHIRCLAWDKNDQLLAGSYQNGYLYRISSPGQAFVVYDSEYQEIHQICLASDGTIYAAGLGQEEPKSVGTKEPVKALRIESISEELDLSAISSKAASIPGITRSGIVKIQPNGMIKNIWQQDSDQVQSITLMEDQSLLVGTGDKGRLFKIDSHRETTLLLNFDASQIIALKPGVAGRIWMATANLGRIFQLESAYEKIGVYESPVVDAQSLTHWGSIEWDEQLPAGCNIKLFSRSGNTEKPNSTWSPWLEMNKGAIIKSPAARFAQWKLELTTNHPAETPKIKNIKLSYLQQNLPPQILSITVHPVERQKEFEFTPTLESSPLEISIIEEPDDDIGAQRQTLPPGARRQLQNGYRRVSWKSQDQNNDKLNYDLHFQEKNEPNWWILKKDLTRTSYIWDSRMMPDGNYRLKVVADDSKSNPINMAKQAEKISDWFIVDNSGPVIEASPIKKVARDSLQISFVVVDELSLIKQVQFSYDVQNWLWIYPTDLVCDSKKEFFQFDIDWEPNQFHSIVIKAEDSAENSSYRRINVEE